MGKSIRNNAILNVIRKTISMIFPLITFPYALRILGTAAYGKYTFSVSIIEYFALFAAYGITNFAIRESSGIRDNKQSMSIFASNMLTFNLLTATVAYIGLFFLIFFSDTVRQYAELIVIQSLCILFSAIGIDWINNVYEDFLYITVRYVIIQMICIVMIFMFVKKPEDIWKYCFITLIGSYGGNIINVFYVRKYVSLHINFKLQIVKYLKPLSILFANSIAVTIYVNSDITMLGIMTTDSDVGIYSLTSKIYNILKYAINSAVVVTIPRLGYFIKNDKSKFEELINDIFDCLLLVVIPVASGLAVMSKEIIRIVGGDEYLTGNITLKILSIALVFALLSSVFTNCILIILKQESKCLYATTISAVTNIILNIVFIPTWGMKGAAITTVIAEMINFIIQWGYVKEIYKLRKLNTLRYSIIGTGITVCCCMLCNFLFKPIDIKYSILRLVSALICSIMLYSLFLFIAKESHFIKIIHFKRK